MQLPKNHNTTLQQTRLMFSINVLFFNVNSSEFQLGIKSSFFVARLKCLCTTFQSGTRIKNQNQRLDGNSTICDVIILKL